MTKTLIYLLLFISFTVSGEDKYAVKGEAWKAWKKMEKVILEGKEKESLDLLSGRMKEGFIRFGMQSIMDEVKAMQPVFVREFPNPKKNVQYLVISVGGAERTLMFIKKGKEWLFDDQNNDIYRTPQDAANSLTIMQVQNRLRTIGELVYTHFFTNNKKKIIPAPEDMNIKKELLSYFEADTGQKRKILMVKGLPYQGSANLLIAVTEKPLNELHYAVFEDGSVKTITVDQFKLHLNLEGIKKQVEYDKNFTDEYKAKLIKLLAGLGAAGFKDRKKARLSLVEEGRRILPFLNKHKNHRDFEIKVSVNEIIKEIENKTGNRPRIP